MKARAILRAVRAPVIVALVYLVLRAIFDGQVARGGLFSPAGQVSVGVAILGGIVLVLRIVVLFVVPALLVYPLVRSLARRIPPRERS